MPLCTQHYFATGEGEGGEGRGRGREEGEGRGGRLGMTHNFLSLFNIVMQTTDLRCMRAHIEHNNYACCILIS
jgi:hypothetical protein